MRIIRYLKEAKVAVIVIALLLVVQAFADLSLPRYTSDLVDVGIQQGGIEDAAPERLRASTYDYLTMLSSGDDETLIETSYEATDDGTYRLTQTGEEQRDALDDAVALPLLMVYYAEQAEGGAQAAPAGLEANADLGTLYAAYEQGLISKDQIQELISQATDQMGSIDESLIDQQAILAAKAEYTALGVDLDAMQIDYLVRIGAQMLGIAAVMMIASVLVGLIASRVSASVAAGLRERLFARVVSFSDAEVQSFSAASLITRGTNDIQQIQMVLVMLLRMVLYAPILAIGGIIMVAQTNVSMSWIIALAIAVIAIVIAILMAVAMPKFKMMQKLIDRVNLVSREMLTGLQVVRAFDRQSHEEARFNQASGDLYRTQMFTNRAMSLMMPAMMLVMNATSVLIVWVGGHAIDAGTLQTGDMIAFITYAMVIVMSFLIIGMISIMLPRADVAAQRVNEVLETESSIADPNVSRAAELPQGAAGLPVEFDHVTFAYEKDSEPVLTDISFTAEAGKTTAIIGATGSGKSTILKLLMRFYDTSEGTVRLGGIDVRDLAQHELRSRIGYVPQKAFLFSGTIEDAIAYGLDGDDDQAVRRAAQIAQASDFIEEKPEGFAAPISQGGTNVSGGQRQRLSIARALATDAPVLVFDDSFSALDYATDARLREALAREAAGKTVIVVAQRISTVLNADEILVLDDGALVGCGTHAELLATCPTYREIAESQLSEKELKGGEAR